MSERSDTEYVEYVTARHAWLRRVAFLLCQDWHSADDLVQVAFTRLFTYWHRAQRVDNLDGYVRTILVRAFLGERRSSWGTRVVLAEVPPVPILVIGAAPGEPAGAVNVR